MTTAPTAFHPILRCLHWSMAAMLLAMLLIGVAMVSTAGNLYTQLLALHRPLGALLLLLALARLGLRLATGAPALPDVLPQPIALAARFSHACMYACMALMPIIGWAMLSAGGYPIRLFGEIILPPLFRADLPLYAVLRQWHGILAYLFFALILSHIAAALWHGLVRRDGVMRSMTFGPRVPSPDIGAPSPEPRLETPDETLVESASSKSPSTAFPLEDGDVGRRGS